MPNLIEAIQAKCTEIREEFIPAYESIGPAGSFAVTMMKNSIAEAEKAIASGDAVRMAGAIEELRGYKL